MGVIGPEQLSYLLLNMKNYFISHFVYAVASTNTCINQLFPNLVKIQSTLVVSNFAGSGKKLETAGVRIKNLAMDTGSYYWKSGHG